MIMVNKVVKSVIFTCALVIPLPLCIQLIELHSPPCVRHLDLLTLTTFYFLIHLDATFFLPSTLSSSTVWPSLLHLRLFSDRNGWHCSAISESYANGQNLKC